MCRLAQDCDQISGTSPDYAPDRRTGRYLSRREVYRVWASGHGLVHHPCHYLHYQSDIVRYMVPIQGILNKVPIHLSAPRENTETPSQTNDFTVRGFKFMKLRAGAFCSWVQPSGGQGFGPSALAARNVVFWEGLFSLPRIRSTGRGRPPRPHNYHAALARHAHQRGLTSFRIGWLFRGGRPI